MNYRSIALEISAFKGSRSNSTLRPVGVHRICRRCTLGTDNVSEGNLIASINLGEQVRKFLPSIVPGINLLELLKSISLKQGLARLGGLFPDLATLTSFFNCLKKLRLRVGVHWNLITADIILCPIHNAFQQCSHFKRYVERVFLSASKPFDSTVDVVISHQLKIACCRNEFENKTILVSLFTDADPV